jgi:hypothetical protein
VTTYLSKQLKVGDYLFLLKISEGSVHGHLAPCFWALVRQNITAVGVCGGKGCSLHGGQKSVSKTGTRSQV